MSFCLRVPSYRVADALKRAPGHTLFGRATAKFEEPQEPLLFTGKCHFLLASSEKTDRRGDSSKMQKTYGQKGKKGIVCREKKMRCNLNGKCAVPYGSMNAGGRRS